MKTTAGFKLWYLIYPIGMYYVVSGVVYFVLQLFLGDAKETYMLRQLICSAATIPVTLSFYRQDKAAEDVVYAPVKKSLGKSFFLEIVFTVLSSACIGIAVNNVIAMTPLVDMSQGFQQANDSFFAGGVLFELLGSCCIIPCAEELLFRGVIYKRLCFLSDGKFAWIASSVLFGVMHVNVVQMLYATIVGLLLAFIVEKTKRLSFAVLGHSVANLIAVVRTETGWLAFSFYPTLEGIAATAVFGMIGILAVWCLYKVSSVVPQTE